MNTVAQPAATAQPAHALDWPALTAALDRHESAQRRALVAWHSKKSMSVLDREIAEQPHFPLIPCNDNARAFAPARGAPAPAGCA